MPTHWHQAFIAAELYSDAWIGIHSESAKEPFSPQNTQLYYLINQRKKTDKRENTFFGLMDQACFIPTGECCIQPTII